MLQGFKKNKQRGGAVTQPPEHHLRLKLPSRKSGMNFWVNSYFQGALHYVSEGQKHQNLVFPWASPPPRGNGEDTSKDGWCLQFKTWTLNPPKISTFVQLRKRTQKRIRDRPSMIQTEPGVGSGEPTVGGTSLFKLKCRKLRESSTWRGGAPALSGGGGGGGTSRHQT